MSPRLVRFAVVEAVVVLLLGLTVLTRGAAGSGPPGPTSATGSDHEGESGAPTRSADVREAREDRPRRPPDPGPAPAPVKPGDALGLVLHGTARDVGGEMLTGYRVTVTAAAEDARSFALATSASADRWALAGVPPGRYRLRCEKSGFATSEEDVELAEAPRLQRRDFVLEPSLDARVRVRFLDPDGVARTPPRMLEEFGWEFVANAVVATAGPLGERIPVDAQGEPRLTEVGRWRRSRDEDGDVAGEVTLSEPPPVWLSVQSRGVVLQSRRVEPGQQTVDFIVTPEAAAAANGAVRLRVVDRATRQPVTDVWVRVGTVSGPPGADGTVTRRLAPGDHAFLIWSDDGRFAQHAGAFHLERGQEIDLGTVALGAGKGCAVTVVDESGDGVDAHLVLSALDTGNARKPMVDRALGQARSDGAFELHAVAPGRQVLLAFTRGRESMGWVSCDGRDLPPELRVVMHPTAPVAIHNALAGDEWVHVSVRDSEGVPIWAEQVTAGSRRGPRLPVGRYRVDVVGQGTTRSYPLRVGPDGGSLEVP